MGLFSALFASLLIALSNLFMRKSLDSGGTTKGFLVIQMFVAFLVSIFVGPLKNNSFDCNVPILLLGAVSGTALAFMLFVLGKALEKGPPGLTFSILSASTVMPGIVLTLLFNFPYTVFHAFGSVLVLAGIFWAGKGLEGMKNFRSWAFLVSLMFMLHILILVIFQWRAILLANPEPLFTKDQIQSQWFMPALYLSAAIVQLALFQPERRMPLKKEWVFGCFAGALNSLCTFFLIQATELATGIQIALVFPLYSIGIIIFSNVWSQKLYEENVNWRAAQVCAFGILIGTIDWNVIRSFF